MAEDRTLNSVLNTESNIPTKGNLEYETFTTSGRHVVVKSADDFEDDISGKTTNTECLMHLLKGMLGTGILAMPVAYRNGGLWLSLAVVLTIGFICTHCMHILVLSSTELCQRTTESLMHLLKGMIGTGVMGLPMAYKNGGLWTGLVVVSLIGIACTHCMHILVQSCNELSRRTNTSDLDYPEVIEKAFSTRNDWMKAWSISARNMVKMFLIALQLGVCCTYIVFVTDNVKQVLEQAGIVTLDSRIYVVIISTLLVPYVMIKKLKSLAPFSAFANILNLIGFLLVLINLFQDLPDSSTRPYVAGFETIPLFFAQTLFAFEAIGMVLPIHKRMIEKSAYLGKAGVLNLGMTITVALYNAVGFYGYLKYGDDTQASITLNLPTNEWLYVAVKIVFALSVFITYALQFYVPIAILWPAIEARHGHAFPNHAEYVFRFLLVLFTCGLSALVPHLDLIIALIGASAGAFLALILPAFIEHITFKCSVFVRIKNGLIISVGLTGFITGTYTSILEIVKRY